MEKEVKHIKTRTLCTHRFINKTFKSKKKYNRKEKHRRIMIENHLDYITEFILNNKLIKDKTNESNIGYVFFELVGVEADEWEIEYIKNSIKKLQ